MACYGMEDFFMACTTILAGKKATLDGSTMIARNDDNPNGKFSVKKYAVVLPEQQPKTYTSVLSHLSLELPDDPMRYTAVPNVDTKSKGIWAASGINAANVGMTATETITSNVRVLGADPLVVYQPAADGKAEQPGGIGEEDIVVLVLPYIHSAREGVRRLGELLETYGTYEMNGIAFNDGDEVWYLESVGGHHWIASRLPDECYAVLPNAFGEDRFDLNDALGEQKNYMCSADLKEFIETYHLAIIEDGHFNPREAFGSHSDADHVYNTPRMWYGQRYFNPTTVVWDGENAQYSPQSDNMPWCRKAEFPISVDDVKYVLSSTYQGTPYDPYSSLETGKLYRPIGINRTAFVSVSQIRSDLPKAYAAIEWTAFASNVFNCLVPQFIQVNTAPAYLSGTTMEVRTDNLYWTSRLISALGDAHHSSAIVEVERYQEALGAAVRHVVDQTLLQADQAQDMTAFLEAANQQIADLAQSHTAALLDKTLWIASCEMTNGYARSDH